MPAPADDAPAAVLGGRHHLTPVGVQGREVDEPVGPTPSARAVGGGAGTGRVARPVRCVLARIRG